MTSSGQHRGADRFTGLQRAARVELVERLAEQHTSVPSLNRLTALAAQLLGVQAGQVSLIGSVEQRVMGGVGAALPSVGQDSPAADSLCTVTVDAGRSVTVDDAVHDVRVQALPPVTSGAVGSYLGSPLVVDGHVVGALCVFDPEPRQWSEHDVSLIEQLAGPVAAELELAALEALYGEDQVLWELAVDAAGVGVFDWQVDSGALRWDERLLELFGLDRDSFGGTIESFDEAVHPDDRDRVGAALAEAVRTVGGYDCEYRIVLPQGGTRWVSARGRAIAGPDGRAARMLGAAYDSTAVHEGEARVSRVLEAMPTGFCQLDREWRFTYANAAAQRLLGGAGVPVVGQVLWELFPATVGTEYESNYRHAVDTGEPVEFEAYYPPPLDRHYEIRAWPTPEGLSLYFLDTSERHAARATVERASRRAALLAEVTRSLTEPLELDESVSRLTHLVVPALGDGCVVTLAHASDRATGAAWRADLHVAGWRRRDPDTPDAADGLVPRTDGPGAPRVATGQSPAHECPPALTDHPAVVHAVDHDAWPVVLRGHQLATGADDGRGPGPAAAVVVPLRGRGRTVGLLTVLRNDTDHPFSPGDLATIADVGGRAGLALGTVSALDEQRELAEGLQRTMLTAPLQPDHVQIAVRYQPAAAAAQVGGDWYDVFMQTDGPDGATVLVIGDVMGHDTAAAAAMAQIRSMLRGIAVATGGGPAAVVGAVDQAMATLRIATTASVVVARLEQTPAEHEAGTTRLCWSNAGHVPPLVVLPAGGSWTEEATEGGRARFLWGRRANPLLGVDPTTGRDEHVATLPRGVTLLLCTDGLVERRGEPLDVGLDRLRDTLTELVDSDVDLERLCDDLLARMQTAPGDDDVALVAVRLHPEDGPRPPEAGPEVLAPGVE